MQTTDKVNGSTLPRPPMPPRTASNLSSEERERERQKYSARLATAVNEDDDPLAAYHHFVQWTLKHYGERDPSSGLKELLQEASSLFKDDTTYKSDLRYLKIWALHARQMDRHGAISTYGFLLENSIGVSYSALYEDYANLLEDAGRLSDADEVYQRGIKKGARPAERLKTRYKEFQSRCASSKPPSSEPSSSRNGESSSKSSGVSYTTTSFNSTAASRYALMLAPPPPGKRPEKLRFNMSLLFTDDGVEYSVQEARARSMGLLGKKWAAPPPSEASRFSNSSVSSSSSSSSAAVEFNDDGHKSSRLKVARRSLMGGAEPTVTINTKEALADVFGMYNSPEKTTKSMIPGSKHAPLKKIEPVTPVVTPRITFSRENENAHAASSKTPLSTLRPLSDENASSNRTPAMKFTPFVDAENKTPFVTPRAVLTVKEAIPATNSRSNLSQQEEKREEPVFKVFTPASKGVPLAPLRDVFTDDHGKPVPKPKVAIHERAKSQHDASNGNRSAFTPFKDENAQTPFKFSRPPDHEPSQNAFTPKTPAAAFTPFVDKTPAFTPFKDLPASTPTPTFKPFVDPGKKLSENRFAPQTVWNPTPAPIPESEPEPEEEEPEEEVNESLQPEPEGEDDYEQYYDEDEISQLEEYEEPLPSENAQQEYEDGDSYREVPLGGRFGQFNVMTPITERTFEFTSSSRMGATTPTYTGPLEALQNAQQLAAELQGDEEDEEAEEEEDGGLESFRINADLAPPPSDPSIAIIEEKAGSLSLIDTLNLSSKFRPANPCNPFDPAILTALLSRIPPDPHFMDLRTESIDQLDNLQRFAKKSRKTSTGSNHAGLSDSFPLVLKGHKFMVTSKLGEGGFGAVFEAKDVGMKMDDDEDDSMDDMDEDDEDEDGGQSSSRVAIKVVKPRSIWEYHALRRLHSTIAPSLRRSLVLPHDLYAFQDESYLVLDLCPQGMLLNIVNNAIQAGVSQAGACLDELLVMFFSIELLRLLEGMHAVGFIHGDLKIDNCLLRLDEVPGGAAAWSPTYQPSGEGGWSYKGLKVIDFGRTIDTRLFPPGQQFIADWATDDRDCFEVRENQPWTYQTDYFGLAGIVYCMLFGKYIQASSVTFVVDEVGEERRKISTPFKRYWQTDLWHRLFDVLLNPTMVRPQGELPVCDALAELRQEMEVWLQSNCNRTSNTLKGLLKKVDLACYK